MNEPQATKTVGDEYELQPEDLGLLLFCMGSVVVPRGLTGGFYCTLVNISGDDVFVRVVGGLARSSSGTVVLSNLYDSCVILKPEGGQDIIALGVP